MVQKATLVKEPRLLKLWLRNWCQNYGINPRREKTYENCATAFVYNFSRWAKNYDQLRVIAVNGTITIEFYVEF